jgi:hypothetical protein
LAVPTFIPASALGRGGAIAPSERITMGFIGVGGQGTGICWGGVDLSGRRLHGRKDVQVLATCDVRRERREMPARKVNDHYREVYGEKFTPCKAYTDFRQVLDRPDIDAVLIATPAHWHATMAAMAAQAGKDIYCEKPSAVTIAESQQMLAAVQRYGRVYQAGTQQRSEYGGKFRRPANLSAAGASANCNPSTPIAMAGAFFGRNALAPANRARRLGGLGPLPGADAVVSVRRQTSARIALTSAN